MSVKEKTRRSIIEASIALFYKKGFAETTFSDIAKKVGLTQPSLYSHFANKMDLLKHTSIYAVEAAKVSIEATVDPKAPAEERLECYLMANLDFFKNKKKLAHAILALYYFSNSSKQIFETFIFVQEKTIDRIETFLIQRDRENGIKVKDKRNLSRVVHSLMVGECFKIVYLKADEERAEVIRKNFWQHAQLLLAR